MFIASHPWIPYEAPLGYALYLPVVAMSVSDLPAEGVRFQDHDVQPVHALVSISGKALRILSNGNAPLNAYPRTGLLLPVGVYVFESDATLWLSKLKFIESAASTELTIEYFRGVAH